MEVRVTRKTEHSDELMHWKYIKRVKKNGKWKYYYDADQLKSDLGLSQREAMVNKTKQRDRMADVHDNNRRKMLDNEVIAKYDTSNKHKERRHKDSVDAYVDSAKTLSETNVEVRALTEKYAKTPIGKMETAVNKGKNFIADKLGITDRQKKKQSEEKAELKLEEQIERTALEESQRKKQKEREKKALAKQRKAELEANKKAAYEKRYAAAKRVLEATGEAKKMVEESQARVKEYDPVEKAKVNAVKTKKEREERLANRDNFSAAKKVINKQQENTAKYDRYASAKNANEAIEELLKKHGGGSMRR